MSCAHAHAHLHVLAQENKSKHQDEQSNYEGDDDHNHDGNACATGKHYIKTHRCQACVASLLFYDVSEVDYDTGIMLIENLSHTR